MLMLGIDFEGLKVLQMVFSVSCQLSVSAASCHILVLAVKSGLEQMSVRHTLRHSSCHVNCNVFQQHVGIIRSSAWKRRNVRPHSGRCASGNRHCVSIQGQRQEKVLYCSYVAEKGTK